jgi:Fe-S oxidoreductase
MTSSLESPAVYVLGGLPFFVISLVLTLVGFSLFLFIITKRLKPLLLAAPAYKFDKPVRRFLNVFLVWLGQRRHPRYFFIGILHIVIFAGFLTLSVHTLSLVGVGLVDDFYFPGVTGMLKANYVLLKNYMATFVLAACFLAILRRIFFDLPRYHVPSYYGKEHKVEAFFILGMISSLMITDSLFEGAYEAASLQQNLPLSAAAVGSLSWLFGELFINLSRQTLQFTYIIAFLLHDITFFVFLCFLPFGKHFHVITSLFNVFFMRVEKGIVKPVRYDVPNDKISELESFGVKKLLDFTWKDILDFYSCVDCGRCSDNCPATAVGSLLSPRFIAIKGKDRVFKHYPVFGRSQPNGLLMGDTYLEPEIWACTTCGACEQECPVGIEYIDKIVDLRRGMVDDGNVPQSLQKPLNSLEKRGNPFGKPEKKRADWTADETFATRSKIKFFDKGDSPSTLYFVDSISSFDDRMQGIAKATAAILSRLGIDFGILGQQERDSGNEVKRFGEEMLYQELKAHNTDQILAAKVDRIITADPHAFNSLKKEYTGLPPVVHISQVLADALKSGKLSLKPLEEPDRIYTYHDPCYLGRHNNLYREPRFVLDSIKNLQRVEMKRSFDRSFCCGGGGLMLFYELEAETRMGVVRAKMAEEAGATTIVTACPFCLVNIEDAIKVAGLEDKLTVVDLSELVWQQMK